MLKVLFSAETLGLSLAPVHLNQGHLILHPHDLESAVDFASVVRPLKSSTKFFFFLMIDPLYAGIESLNPLNTTPQSALRQEVLTKRTGDWIAMNRKSTANLRNT